MDAALEKALRDAYDAGLQDGLEAFAINRNGEQWVGSPERTLRKALGERRELWNHGYSLGQVFVDHRHERIVVDPPEAA